MKNNIKYIVLLTIVLLSSCKDDKVKVVEIPDKLQGFVDSFILEGQKRGVEVNIDDLIMEFESDLEVGGSPAAGLCRTQGDNTPVILIDTTSSNWTLNLSSREQLVFHELGHCYLGRPHIENRMPNGNFRSIMRPSGEQLYGPNLGAFKREFYLDELFSQQTMRPSWADLTAYSSHAALQRSAFFVDDFSNNDKGWLVGSGSNVERKILGGVYDFKSLTTSNTIVSTQDILMPEEGNFEIEVDISFQNENSFAAFIWGGQNLTVKDYNFVYLTAESVVLIGTLDEGFESTLEVMFSNNGSSTTLTIRHVDGFYYIYLDEVQIETLEYKLINGVSGGLGVGPGGHVQFDNLRVYKLD